MGAYLRHEDAVFVPELHVLTLEHMVGNKTLCINDGELIVGEKGDNSQSVPMFPELCYHTMEDIQAMNDRGPIPFEVSQVDLKLQKERIIPHWQSRSTRHKVLESVTPKWRGCYESDIFTEFVE